MQLFRNAVLVTNRQPIAFKCRACGVCCKNVRDSIVLEPLDAYRIVRDKQKNGCTDSADDILWNMAELKELSPGFHVFVLRTVNAVSYTHLIDSELEASAKEALAQIERQQYVTAMKQQGITHFFKVGVSFYKKHVKLLSDTE